MCNHVFLSMDFGSFLWRALWLLNQNYGEHLRARFSPGARIKLIRYRAVSRIPNPNPKAANSLPLRLLAALGLGLGIRGLHLALFSWFGLGLG